MDIYRYTCGQIYVYVDAYVERVSYLLQRSLYSLSRRVRDVQLVGLALLLVGCACAEWVNGGGASLFVLSWRPWCFVAILSAFEGRRAHVCTRVCWLREKEQ